MGGQNNTDRKKTFWHTFYEKLAKIDDAPQRVVGFGGSIFIGNLSGVAPITTLIAAAILWVNKASAFNCYFLKYLLPPQEALNE